MIKKLFFLTAAFCAVLLNAAPLEIVKKGKSEYVIFLPPDALPGPREAAKELQYLIHRATGAKLPIVTEKGKKKGICFVSEKNLPPEGFRIRSRNGELFISGDDGSGNPRRFPHTEYNRTGSWFAVNHIAERFLEFRQFFPGEPGIYLPRREELTLPEMELSSAPKMVYRNFTIWYHVPDRKFRADMDLWKRRAGLGESLGWYNNHMWRYILPPEKYLDKHPEWFAMLNGRRSRENFGKDEGLKICTSNMEALKEFARVSVERARKSKSRYVSITPNDGIRFCECPECTKDDFKNPDGSLNMSDRIFLYANRLAEMITKELPQVKISMLAYSFYRKPPRKITKLHPAIELMYVQNTADTLYYRPEKRAEIVDDMKNWLKIVPSLYFYNTPGSPLHLPLVNIENLKKLYADLAELGIRGYAIENFESFWSSGINNYLYARMSSDPGADFDALYNDTLEKCYGKTAAPLVRAYHRHIGEGHKKYALYTAGKNIDYRKRYDIMLERCWNGLYEKHYAPLEEAMKKTADAGQKKRLEMVLSNLKYVKMTLELYREAKKLLGRPAASSVAVMKVVKLAEERKKYILQISRQNPEVVPAVLEREEKWYRLPFDPVMLKKQLLGKTRPYVSVAWGNEKAQMGVVASEAETGTVLPLPVRGSFFLRGGEKNLTIDLMMREPLMKEINDSRVLPDSDVWEDNCVDIFFDPDCTGKNLIHLIANTRGTLYAAKAEVKKWNHKITVKAKLEKNCWRLQIVIPWEDLGGRPPKGTRWGFNVCRVRKTVSPAVYSCWSPTYGLFDKPEFFGRIRF